jgi:pimeloyl-ACP methyl ester carboxylesterase
LKNLSLFLLLWLAIITTNANAEIVETKLEDAITVTAEYHAASPGKPTILLLHPFLQTRHFPIIRELTSRLANNGFGVLAPTLSLGISHRRQGLACEAIHTRTFDQNIQEISAWLKWLKAREVSNIIGAGHGMGAIMMLAFASSQDEPAPFESLILVTLTYVSPQGGVRINSAQLEKARADDAGGLPDFLDGYTMAFCNRYIAPRKVYLSLAKWGQDAVLSNLGRLTIPVHVILGTADTKLMARQWPDKLQSAGANVRLVEGAGHFFSSEYTSSLFQTFVSLSELTEHRHAEDD